MTQSNSANALDSLLVAVPSIVNLADLAEAAGHLTPVQLAPYVLRLLSIINERTASLGPGRRLSGLHFDTDTPPVVIQRVLGLLAIEAGRAEIAEPALGVLDGVERRRPAAVA